MKRYSATLLLFLFAIVYANASHIVGGEIELQHFRGNNYQILYRMYVDEIHQNNNVIASETQARVLIFDKTTNKKVADVTLERPQHLIIQYGENCTNTTLVKTGVLVFTGSVYLDPAIYTNPDGYYMSVENCCRNSVIENIKDPGNTGMTFYTEFSPIIKNGVKFLNSTPHFNQIIGDYPCLNKDFYFDMSGTDKDGDSLVYKLDTPLDAHVTSSAQGQIINLGPAPYPQVLWDSSYTTTDQIHGNPSLSIDLHKGLLHLKANQEGLYVFGIVVEEYRNGVMIGKVKRDFQMPVVKCDDNAPPSISLTPKNKPNYNPSSDTLKINVEQDTCFTVIVSDSNTVDPNGSDRVKINILSNNIPPSIFSISPEVYLTHDNDTAVVNFCLSACNKLDIDKDTTFTISLVVTDAPKCPSSLAYYDTLNVVIRYKPQINSKPKIGIVQGTGPFTIVLGNPLTLDVFGTDVDKLDNLVIVGEGEEFDMYQKGMFFNNVSGHDSISSQFRWFPSCSDLDPGTYKVRFTLDDNSCVFDNSDTTEITIKVEDKSSNITNIKVSNLFTPNNDGMNDFFEIPLADDGNCDFYFKKVTIFNRWGGKIYESTNPTFKWDGGTQPGGLYYVYVDMNKKQYKGWLEMVK